jgi:hypothetical protein
LIRSPKSAVLRDYLGNSVKKLPRLFSFEELHSTMYALQQSYKATGGEPAALKQI